MDSVNGASDPAATTTDGDTPTSEETDAAPSTTANSDAIAATTGSTSGAEEEVPTAVGTEEPAAPPAALTGAQRLAQARRRRYRKPAVAATAVDDGGGDRTDAAVGDGEDGNVVVPPTVEVAAVAGGGGLEPVAVVDSSPVTEKKKYLGVAKMRRKRLAERKVTEEIEITKINDTMKKSRPAVNIPVLPIFFQLITILALFLAGFDVGVQNHYMGTYQTVSSGPNVVSSLSVFDNGYGILSTLGLHHRHITTTDIFSDITTTTIMQPETPILLDTEEDEFQTTKPLGATTTTHRPPNIDPIFQVDLDELTLDKTGILMFLCRIAIRFHRCITYFFYLLPKSILQGIWGYNPFSGGLPSFQSAIQRSVFCGTAVLVRTVGKYVLGAADRVPELETMLEMRMDAETGNGLHEAAPTTGIEKAGKTLENLDIMGMGVDYAKKFMENNFSTVVVLYRFFQHVKSDMYVVLCGFFLGLVLPVEMMVQAGAGKEEL